MVAFTCALLLTPIDNVSIFSSDRHCIFIAQLVPVLEFLIYLNTRLHRSKDHFLKNADEASASEAEAEEQLWSAKLRGNTTKDADQSDFHHMQA